MAKQTFTTGQVLTAAQLTNLQQTAMGGGSTTAKTTSYVLVAADAGTVIQMNAAGATTITVNTALFAAGDSVQIQNIGAGVCTVTAGTATVTTAGSLALSQWEGGQLYFSSASASIFFDIVQSSAAGGKVLQVVSATYSTSTGTSSATYSDTGLTATITPTLNTSKVLVLVSQNGLSKSGNLAGRVQLMANGTAAFVLDSLIGYTATTATNSVGGVSASLLHSPATTSAVIYKTQFASDNGATFTVQAAGTTSTSTITLMEIGA